MPTVHTIEITHEDIERGEQGNPWGCPIARAASREWPELKIGVGGGLITGWKAGILVASFKLPDTVRAWQGDFDRGKFVHPLVFKVTDPC